jgi:hypothetical protein
MGCVNIKESPGILRDLRSVDQVPASLGMATGRSCLCVCVLDP